MRRDKGEKYVHLRSAPSARGWVGLPLEESVDPLEWARTRLSAAAEGLELLEDSLGEEGAAQMLAHFIRLARADLVPNLSAHLALVLLPDPLGPVLAAATVTVFPFEGRKLTVKYLMRNLGTDDSTVGERQVDDIWLPVGRGVRLRRMFGVERGETGEPTGPAGAFIDAGDVMEGITYVFLPEGLPGYVLLNATWGDLVRGDAIAGMVDLLAAGLSIDFRQ